MYNRKIRGPLIEGNKSLGQITEEIVSPMEVKQAIVGYGGAVSLTPFMASGIEWRTSRRFRDGG